MLGNYNFLTFMLYIYKYIYFFILIGILKLNKEIGILTYKQTEIFIKISVIALLVISYYTKYNFLF